MGSPIIEVGIGLLFIFLLMSILVSQINNIIKNRLNVRGAYYQQELTRLLQDPVIRDRLFNHPAIGLADINENDAIKRITAEKLADVLVDLLAGNGETLEQLENLTNSPLVNRVLDAIDNPDLRARLEQVLMAARSLPDVRLKLIDWFDGTLNRAGELYKRRMAFFSLVAGALLAVLLNVDTIYIGQSLWDDPVLRQTTVDAASVAIEQIDPNAPLPETPGEDITTASRTFNTLMELRLPMGWYVQDLSGTSPESPLWGDSRNLWNFWPANNAEWLSLLVTKIIGIALTTLAVMQGAPFWFDLLRRAGGSH